MTQAAAIPWSVYIGDGSTLAFAYPWYIAAASELEVYLQGVFTTAFTVTGIGNPSGGNVQMFNPPISGQTLFVRRVTPQTQMTDYTPNDPFDAAAHEAALDKLTRMVQDVYERISRSPAFVVSATNAMRDLLFPTGAPLKLLGWDATGTALTLFDSTIQQVTVNPSSGEAHGVSVVNVPSVGGLVALTAPALIPAGVKVKGVGYRCTVPFSTENALASVDLGGMGLVNGWGRALGITVGSINNEGTMRSDEPRTQTAQTVTLLANPAGALFGALGMAKLTVFWRTLTPAA